MAQPFVKIIHQKLAASCSACDRCGLCAKPKDRMWGEGSLSSGLMVLLPASHGAEHRAAITTVKRLLKSMELDAYITPIVKCRGTELKKRQASYDEIVQCRPWLERQIRLIKPRVIVTVGPEALSTFVGQTIRPQYYGEWVYWEGVAVMPTELHSTTDMMRTDLRKAACRLAKEG